MKSYSVIIGSRNSRGTFSRRDKNLVQEITARHFPAGFTILDARGGWYDPTSKVFKREETRQILVCTTRPTKLPPWCRELGKALGQKEVLLVVGGTVRQFQLKSSG